MTGFGIAAGARSAGESFAAGPFFQYSFSAFADTAQGPALREVLNDALRQEAQTAVVLLERHAEHCVAAGSVREARDSLRRAVLLQPALAGPLRKLLALAKAAGRQASHRWSSAGRVLTAAHAATLSEAVRVTAERWFGPVGHYEALRSIGELLRPEVYLEIGVDAGGSLEAAWPGARRIGIDPSPRLDPARHPGLELYRTTSDAFFASAERQVPGLAVDLAFIDGLHEARQLLRDFRETERRCRRGATIVLHDVLPLHPASADPVRRLDFWVGDCWRVPCLLAELRPDLEIAIVRCAPSGLALIRNPDPDDRRLFAAGARLHDRLAGYDLGRDFVPLLLRLPMLEPDRDSLSRLLSGAWTPAPGAATLRPTAGDLRVVRAGAEARAAPSGA